MIRSRTDKRASAKWSLLGVATSTNLMCLTVTKGSTQQFIKIDVNKKVSTLSKAREFIENMAISDRYATLYICSGPVPAGLITGEPPCAKFLAEVKEFC